ncbi:hypothetical protein LCGC14_1561290 [marine sediment metagenome]|uniref:Uncharacterized protein n=1 Tax=marine sediment metagenome TaxID=412755 RepID=A0A0F9IME1_9ZZZZ
MRLPYWIKSKIAKWKSRKGIHIDECWQDKAPGKYNQISEKYRYYGAFTVYYKGRIVGRFDVGVLDDPFPRCKILIPKEQEKE